MQDRFIEDCDCETPSACCEDHELYVCAYHEEQYALEDLHEENRNEQYERAVKLNYD